MPLILWSTDTVYLHSSTRDKIQHNKMVISHSADSESCSDKFYCLSK